MKGWSYLASVTVLVAGAALVMAQRDSQTSQRRVPLTFSGGHETDRRDGGRPISLIAPALGVPEQVFRDAFSHVRPAPGGTPPEPDRVRENKAALLGALSKYGVENERLDEVSNYYRYRPQDGEIWPTTEAAGYAVLDHAVVAKLVLTNPGSGYSSPPSVSVAGLPGVSVTVTMSYGRDLENNGSVRSLDLTLRR